MKKFLIALGSAAFFALPMALVSAPASAQSQVQPVAPAVAASNLPQKNAQVKSTQKTKAKAKASHSTKGKTKASAKSKKSKAIKHKVKKASHAKPKASKPQ